MKSDTVFLILSTFFAVTLEFNVVVKKLELCDLNARYPIRGSKILWTIGKQQFMDANATLDVSLDDDLFFNFTSEMLIGSSFVHLFTISDKGACGAIHKYMGEFVYDIERAAQLIPGLCPIRKGKYHVHGVALNFNKMTLQAVPAGIIRFTTTCSDGRNGRLVSCLKALAETTF